MRIKAIWKKKLRSVESKNKCNSKIYLSLEKITIKRSKTKFDKTKN